MASRSSAESSPARPQWAGLILVGGALLIAFGLLDSIARFPRGLLTDDAYFYAKIASNLARDGVSSFDGIHPTDGYHLLWTWVLAGVSWLVLRVTADSGVHLSAMIAAYLLIAAWIGLRFGRTLAWAIVLFLLSVVFKMLMETTLLAFLLLVLSEELLWRPSRGRRGWWKLILCALLVPLVRIDALFMPMLVAVGALMARGDRRSGWLVGASSALGGGLQLTANHAISGHWMSVSAQIKAAPLAIGQNLAANLTGLYWGGLISFGLFVLAVLFALLRARRQAIHELRWGAYAVLATATAFVVAHLLFNNCIRYWYYVPALYLVLQTVFESSPGREGPGLRAFSRVLAVALLVGLVGKYAVDSHLRSREIAHSSRFVTEVKRLISPETLIFQIDGTGFIGYFTERSVINGDGLVNTHEFAGRLREDDLAGYLDENGVEYLIHNSYPVHDKLITHHGLVVRSEDVQALVSPPAGLARHTAFGLYKLAPESRRFTRQTEEGRLSNLRRPS